MITVMVIEDNSLFRSTLVDVINRDEALTCEYDYSSCEEALREIQTYALDSQVILLDIGLPGMNGVEGLPRIKRLCPDAKIIMLTIHDDDENIFRAICSGAAGYLLKDMSAEAITNAIQEVLNGGAPMNSHIAKKILDLFKKITVPPGDYGLTQREKEILRHLVEGMSKKQIADSLYISYHTVDAHIRHIYEKLEVNSRGGVVAKALKEKLL